MKDFEEDSQEVTHGVFIPPLSKDHWSLQPEYKKLKAEMSETTPASAPDDASVAENWKLYAYALSGAQEEAQ